MSAYIVSIACVLQKRLRHEPLPPRRWSLGPFGLVANIASLVFLLPLFVFAFFPLTSEFDSKSMNWGIVMYVGVIGFASGYYVVKGRKQFVAPVALVRRGR